MDQETDQSRRELEPVCEQAVRERRQHRLAGADAGQRQRRRQAGFDEAEPARGDRHLGEHLCCAEGEQHQRGARRRADRGKGGEQGRVVERPPPDRRRQRLLPVRPERRQQPVALTGQPLGERAQRLGAPPQAVAHRLHRAAHELERAVEGEQRGPSRQEQREHHDSHDRGLDQAAIDRAADEGGQREHRQRQHHREREQVDRGYPRHRPAALEPRGDEHLVLQGGADRASRRGDLGDRVARQLGLDHVRPPGPVEGHPLHRPEAREAAGLKREHRRKPDPIDAIEVLPRAEHIEQAGADQIQGDARDREPDRRTAQARANALALRLPTLDLALDVDVVLDLALDAVAKRPATACSLGLVAGRQAVQQ